VTTLLISSPWGGSLNNCYSLLEMANSYIRTAKIFFDEWLEFKEKQPAALITATQQIDAQNWSGEKWFYNQLLEFPRFDPEGEFPYGSYSRAAPDLTFAQLSETDEYLRQQRIRVQIACAEQAFFLLRQRGINAHREDQYHGIRSQSRGGRVAESFGYGDPDLVLCPEAWDQLRPYVGSMRVVRR